MSTDTSKSYTYTIPRKMSGTGTIHDLASEHNDRDIVFGAGCVFAVVKASYYGGKGYTTHKTEAAAAKASRAVADYSHQVIDRDGESYTANYDRLISDQRLSQKGNQK